jgi:hypothetical protein
MIALGALLATAAASASATDLCQAGPKGAWIKPDAVRRHVVAMGYKDFTLGIEDGCYEAKAIDQDHKRSEIYIDPMTGEVVKIKKDGKPSGRPD